MEDLIISKSHATWIQRWHLFKSNMSSPLRVDRREDSMSIQTGRLTSDLEHAENTA